MDRHWRCALAAVWIVGLLAALAGCGDESGYTPKESAQKAVVRPSATAEPAPTQSVPAEKKVAPEPADARTDGKQEPRGGDANTLEVEGLVLRVPAGWVRRPPASQMRLAEFRLPKAEGDPADGELAVTYFPGGGGGVAANLQRWFGQFTQPDGKATKEVAKVESKEVGGLKVTLADIPGTYREPFPRPGQKQVEFPGYRLLGAIVEAPDGAAFFKLIGPAKTVGARKGDFDSFIASLKRR